MAISRVTIGGWRQETGTTSRVTLNGWRQETVAGVTDTNRQPAAGTIVVAGQAPILGHTLVAAGTTAVIVGGFAPTLILGTVVQPGAGSAEATGLAPAIIIGTVTQPGAGSVEVTGLAPLTGHTLPIGLGSAEVQGFAPTVIEGAAGDTTITPGCGTAEVQGFAPTVSVTNNVVILVPAGSAEILGLAPTVTGGEATPSEQPVIGGVGKPRHRYPSLRREHQRTWVELRDGKVYQVDDAQEAKKVVTTIRKQAERRVRQAVKAEVPIKEFPPLPVIDVGGEYREWLAGLQREVAAVNMHLEELYAKAQAEWLLRIDDEDTITALLWQTQGRTTEIVSIGDEDDAITALLLT